MVSVARVLFCFLCLAIMPVSVVATTASTEIFPALRKRRQLKLASTQKQTENPQTLDTMGPTQPVENKESEVPAAVPAPVDVGKDGYPQLPAVSQMLSGASGTLKTVNSQASGLEAHVVQAQMQIEAKMAKQKAAFEEKLKEQEEKNRLVIEANNNITTEINSLNRSNANLRTQSHDIEHANQVMRSQLQALGSRLGAAKAFTVKSLSSTDDSKNALLQVLHGGHHIHRHSLVQTSSNNSREADDDDDEDDESTEDSDASKDDSENDDSADDKDDDGDDEESTSFLSLSMKVHRTSAASASTATPSSLDVEMSELESAVPTTSPGDLLEVLAHEVAQLSQQEKASEKTLKQLFIRDFRAGARRKAALLEQQKALNGTRSYLLTLQGKLQNAKAHLESTHKRLEARLHGLAEFLQKLAHLAMSPPQEAPHLLEILPKDVPKALQHV